MDLVLCHTTADFDTLGAAVGITQLQPGTRIVLTGGSHPDVQAFLALHRDAYPLLDHRAVDPTQIRSLTLVDVQRRSQVGVAADWIDQAIARDIPITIYDHHATGDVGDGDPNRTSSDDAEAPAASGRLDISLDIPQANLVIEPVGAITTAIVERLRGQDIALSPPVATVMALGIHADTGSLRYEQTQPRDAAALAWLMRQGADQRIIAAATETALSDALRRLLATALIDTEVEQTDGYSMGWLCLRLAVFVPGLSTLASQLMSCLSLNALLLGAIYPTKSGASKLTLIGRARRPMLYPSAPAQATPASPLPIEAAGPGPNFSQLFTPLGGGGHPQAAAAVVRSQTASPVTELTDIFDQVLAQLRQQVPQVPRVGALMSSPVRTVRPNATISQAQRVLLRYGHAGLCVVNDADQLVGLISRRDIELALHHGFGHAPVKGYMTTQIKTVTPDTPVPAVRELMVTYDIGRLPVLAHEALVGIVTRSDLLRQIQADYLQQRVQPGRQRPHTRSADRAPTADMPTALQLKSRLQKGLPVNLWTALMQIAAAAEQQGWQLYLVGGAVRDLLLTPAGQSLQIQDIDLVVDGHHDAPAAGAGVALAEAIRQQYPEVHVQVHGQFQTAALTWSKQTPLGPLLIDIATARTEFYAYPAANPEVDASSIRQDLYRRDFTINAMAIRLTSPQVGQLLDFFGGWLDLQTRDIRVLHANSFIEDPTRIFRAVRFAARLGFQLDAQTEAYIRYAIASGIYTDLQRDGLPNRRLPALQTRLRAELKYLLSAPEWSPALDQLQALTAFSCIHPDLALTPGLRQQLGRLNRWYIRLQWAEPPWWQLALEALLASLGTAAPAVAASLALPEDSQQRLTQLPTAEAQLLAQLPGCQRPSDRDRQLQALTPPLLWLAALRHPRRLGPIIWHYLLHLRRVQSVLDGHDLRRLGYTPGPQFKHMLADLRAATLDGQITDANTAESYIKQRYPHADAKQKRPE